MTPLSSWKQQFDHQFNCMCELPFRSFVQNFWFQDFFWFFYLNRKIPPSQLNTDFQIVYIMLLFVVVYFLFVKKNKKWLSFFLPPFLFPFLFFNLFGSFLVLQFKKHFLPFSCSWFWCWVASPTCGLCPAGSLADMALDQSMRYECAMQAVCSS